MEIWIDRLREREGGGGGGGQRERDHYADGRLS